jgi:hypothetical protein
MAQSYDAWAARCGVIPWEQLQRDRKAEKKTKAGA